jgi:hypothetical protein
MVANEAAGEQKPEAYPPGYVEEFLRIEDEISGHFQPPLFGNGNELSYPRTKAPRIPALNVHEPRASEPADKSFA